jgi:hypothetical protein
MMKATAKGLPAGSATATRTDPTSAVPSEDPRLDRLRDRPEISPWSESGKLDWTTLTDEVSMTPTPMPNSSSPGTQVQNAEWALTSVSSSTMPATLNKKPTIMSHRWGCRLANRSAPADAARIPIVAGVSSRPVLIAL